MRILKRIIFSKELISLKRMLNAKKMMAVLLVLALLFSSVACGNNNSDTSEYEAKLASLVYRKQVIYEELEKLNYEVAIFGCMSFVFTQLNSGIYEDVYPIFHTEKYNIVGVFAFSEDELPGLDDKITWEQYNELISLGWGTSLFWDGEGELSEYLENMTSVLSEYELELPKSLMFETGKYLAEYDTLLTQYGIENIIHAGDTGLPIVEAANPDGAWHPGYMGWRTYNKSTKLKASIETVGGYAVFRIAFDNSAENVTTSFYGIPGESTANGVREEVFERMLDSFKKSIDNGTITVENIENARDLYRNYMTEKINKKTYTAEKRAELEAELASVEKKITELYDEYH